MEVPVEKLFQIIEQKYKESKNKKNKDKKYNQLVWRFNIQMRGDPERQKDRMQRKNHQ